MQNPRPYDNSRANIGSMIKLGKDVHLDLPQSLIHFVVKRSKIKVVGLLSAKSPYSMLSTAVVDSTDFHDIWWDDWS